MNLTSQQQALLDGAKGPAMAKVVKTLVMYGECFGAERMVPRDRRKRSSCHKFWPLHARSSL